MLMRLKVIFALLIFTNESIAMSTFSQLQSLYEEFGGQQYMIGEQITQSLHVRTAAQIARLAGAPDIAVLALLFHDVGQISDSSRVGKEGELAQTHDDIGAEWLLQQGFSADIADFAKYHTLAKIVLVEQDSNYFDHLSHASQASYWAQKEKFSARSEVRASFEQHEMANIYLTLRRCDDMAKVPDLQVADFTAYQSMIEDALLRRPKWGHNPQWQQEIEELQIRTWRDPDALKKWLVEKTVTQNG